MIEGLWRQASSRTCGYLSWETPNGQAQRPAPTNGLWKNERHTLQANVKIRSASRCGRTRPARRSSDVSIVNLFIASLRPKTIHSRQRKACSINTWALRKPHAQTAARVNQSQCTKQVRHLHTMLKKHGWQSQNLFQASCQHREPHPGRQSYPHWMA